MCTTCDYTKYERTSDNKLRTSLNDECNIVCDINGKNYMLEDSITLIRTFKIYRCPTCGRKLY